MSLTGFKIAMEIHTWGVYNNVCRDVCLNGKDSQEVLVLLAPPPCLRVSVDKGKRAKPQNSASVLPG